jgi:hypothetical protein
MMEDLKEVGETGFINQPFDITLLFEKIRKTIKEEYHRFVLLGMARLPTSIGLDLGSD